MTLRIVKSMDRDLTEAERKQVVEFCMENETWTMAEIVAHFEKEFNMPVTEHAVLASLVGTLPVPRPKGV